MIVERENSDSIHTSIECFLQDVSASGGLDNASNAPSGASDGSTSNEQVKLVIYSNSQDNLRGTIEMLDSMLVDAVELKMITGEDALKLELKVLEYIRRSIIMCNVHRQFTEAVSKLCLSFSYE